MTMANQFPFHAIVQIQLYGNTPEDVQVALRDAYEKLATNVTKGQAFTADSKGGYSFSVSSVNQDDDRPAPAIPPQV